VKVFFTADEHYGHENARTGWGDPAKARPFVSLENMREELIARHNAVVGKGDEVWHLGDMFWRTLSGLDAAEIVLRLNGKHCYVLGNHEERMRNVNKYSYPYRCFQEVNERWQMHLPSSLLTHSASEPASKPAHRLIILDHYAGRVWAGSHRGSWQLHGHSHGMLCDIGLLQMDVGVDCNNFAPVSLEQVSAFMRKRELGAC